MKQLTRIKRATIAVGLIAVLGVSLVPAANAHRMSSDSRVTADYGRQTFRGDIAARPRCRRNRTITVFKIKKNGDLRTVGSDETNGDGNWAVPTDPQPENGRYFARATGRRGGRYGHSHRCEGDRSPTMRL